MTLGGEETGITLIAGQPWLERWTQDPNTPLLPVVGQAPPSCQHVRKARAAESGTSSMLQEVTMGHLKEMHDEKQPAASWRNLFKGGNAGLMGHLIDANSNNASGKEMVLQGGSNFLFNVKAAIRAEEVQTARDVAKLVAGLGVTKEAAQKALESHQTLQEAANYLVAQFPQPRSGLKL